MGTPTGQQSWNGGCLAPAGRGPWKNSGPLLACGAAVVLLAGGAAWAAADPPPAAQFYDSHCAACHGQNGNDPTLLSVYPDLPDFTNAKWQAAHTREQLKDVILNGKGAMPAYKGSLGGLTAGQLVDYVRKFAPGTGDPPSAAQFYDNRCAACHGKSGKNPQLSSVYPDLPDFTSAQWQAAHTREQLKDVILSGKGAMPVYKGDLDGLTAGQLVDYIRKFAPQH